MAETIMGKRIRVSLATSDLGEAVKERNRIRADPGSVLLDLVADNDPVEGWVTSMERAGISRSWQEHGKYVVRGALKAMAMPAEGVSEALVERWVSETRKRTGDATARAYLQRVQGFYVWMVKSGRMRKSPAAAIVAPRPAPNVRRMFLGPEDARRLIDECENEGLKFALYCSLHAGLRKGEIIAARPEWFDLKAGLLHVQNGPGFTIKDRDDRTIPLTDEFLSFLESYGLRKPFMLAPEVQGGNHRYRFDFRKAFLGHLKRCELEGYTFHDLRRTFASLLVSAGVSVYKVAKWLGDGVEVVEKRYGHLVANDAEINAAWGKTPEISTPPTDSPHLRLLQGVV